MSMLKKVLLGLLAFVVALVLIGFFLPASVHVERSITIEAPQTTIFALLNGFRTFNRWSSWAARDPQTEYLFEGPDSGVGARMSWVSDNPQVGSGSREITLSEPYSRVETELDFGAQGKAQAFYALSPAAEGTEVTWGFDTDFGLNLVQRYMGLMFDSWIGADYEQSLANLKTLAEGLPTADWTDMEIGVVDIEPAVIAVVPASAPWDAEAIGQALAEAQAQIGRFLAEHGLETVGPPLAITTEAGADVWAFEAGIPIAAMMEIDIDPASPVQIRETTGGKTVRGVSVGPHAEIPGNWAKVLAWAAAHGYEATGATWEEYVSDPGDTPEEDLITHLHLPVG